MAPLLINMPLALEPCMAMLLQMPATAPVEQPLQVAGSVLVRGGSEELAHGLTALRLRFIVRAQVRSGFTMQLWAHAHQRFEKLWGRI